MTILNVYKKNDSIIVGSDSESIVGGKTSRISKIFPLPHIDGVLAGCGTTAFHLHVLNVCAVHNGDFDSLAKEMPDMLRSAHKHFRRDAWKFGLSGDALIDRQTVILAGWSKALDSASAYVFDQETRQDGFTSSVVDESFITPWDERLSNCQRPDTAFKMARLAQTQSELFLGEDPGSAAGGRFYVAHISKNEVAIRGEADLCSPVDRPSLKNQGGRLVRWVRAWQSSVIVQNAIEPHAQR